MPVPQDIINDARKFRREALLKVLASSYPTVCRMAYGLSGREDVGQNVVRFVMARGVRQAATWKNEGDPERWFDHHTVLMWRRAARFAPHPLKDVLASEDDQHSAHTPLSYIAFIRAMRHLPPQQREAFILHAGEGYDERRMGIAMDCSRGAAANHLAAARRALMAVSGDAFDAHLRMMHDAYTALTPREDLVLPAIRQYLDRHLWPRRLRRAAKIIAVLAVLAALTYAIWWLGKHIEW
jgi:DNA-directed RNA polymerase specialized sigma24 family protein